MKGARGDIPDTDEHIGCRLDRCRRACGELLDGNIEATRHDREVMAFDEAGQLQFVEEREHLRRLPSALGQETQAIVAARFLCMRAAATQANLPPRR